MAKPPPLFACDEVNAFALRLQKQLWQLQKNSEAVRVQSVEMVDALDAMTGALDHIWKELADKRISVEQDDV